MLLREPREAAVPVPSLSGPRRLWFPARCLARLKGFNCTQVREAFDFFPKLARRFWLPRGPPGLPRLGGSFSLPPGGSLASAVPCAARLSTSESGADQSSFVCDEPAAPQPPA